MLPTNPRKIQKNSARGWKEVKFSIGRFRDFSKSRLTAWKVCTEEVVSARNRVYDF